MPGVLAIGLGLVCILVGACLRKGTGRTRLSTALVCIGVLPVLAGAAVFFLVAADVVKFPLH